MADLLKVRSNASHPKYDPRKPSVTSIMPDGDVPNLDGLTADEAALVALGYKQEFKREFSLWTTFCVSFAVLGLLPSFASTLYYGMGYAGTGGMVWGWLISWIFIQCVAMGMAELCSSMPTRYVSHHISLDSADDEIVEDSIMLLQSSPLLDTAHSRRG